MRPPSALLPSHTMLCWLFCNTLLMFFNISADAQQSEPWKEMGLAGIEYKEEELELPKDSWYIRSKYELDQYEYTKYDHKDKTFSPCKVDIGGDGFEVFYDKLASSKGCTVDLIINKKYQAIFTAKMMDLDKNCISKADNDDEIVEKSNDNLIPFVFSYANNILLKLSEGPTYGSDWYCEKKEKCKKSYGQDGKCIKMTMLEIGWSRSNDESIYGHLHQVGEPVSSWNIKMNKKEEWDGKMEVELNIVGMKKEKPKIEYHIKEHGATDEGFSFIIKEKGDQPVCNFPVTATPTPLTWQIKSTTDEFLNGKELLILHFFPQKSTVYHYGKEGEWKVNSSKKIDGPKCKKQSFVFPRSFAKGLLMVGQKPEPKTPSTSTQSTTEITSGSTGMPITEETTSTKTSKQTAVETTATTSEFPQETTETTPTIGPSPTSKQAADSGSSTVLIISIVAGLIAFIILIAILIYCLCCRKKEVANGKEEDEEDSSEVENSEVFENYQKKQQPSLMITEKKKPTGEITTDWTDYETIEPKKKTNVV